MKKLMILFTLSLISMGLCYAQVGKIRFVLGDVKYKATQNHPYKAVTLELPIVEDGFILTGPDSSVEVQWQSGGTTTIGSNKQVSVRKLFEDASSKQNWKNRLENKVGNLKLQNKRRASSTAGIRREESEVSRDSLLFWYEEPKQSIDEAIALFDNKQYARSIPLFEKVIAQAPLRKDAELSHAYLILIYDAIGERQKIKEHVNVLKKDFPNSTTLDSLPVE